MVQEGHVNSICLIAHFYTLTLVGQVDAQEVAFLFTVLSLLQIVRNIVELHKIILE